MKLVNTANLTFFQPHVIWRRACSDGAWAFSFLQAKRKMKEKNAIKYYEQRHILASKIDQIE